MSMQGNMRKYYEYIYYFYYFIFKNVILFDIYLHKTNGAKSISKVWQPLHQFKGWLVDWMMYEYSNKNPVKDTCGNYHYYIITIIIISLCYWLLYSLPRLNNLVRRHCDKTIGILIIIYTSMHIHSETAD